MFKLNWYTDIAPIFLMMIWSWSGWYYKKIIGVSQYWLLSLYVLDGVLRKKWSWFVFLSIIEETEVIVNLMGYDVWEAEDEGTGLFIDRFES